MKTILITIGVIIFCAVLAVITLFGAVMIAVSDADLRADE
jgi:hypothetical protein